MNLTIVPKSWRELSLRNVLLCGCLFLIIFATLICQGAALSAWAFVLLIYVTYALSIHIVSEKITPAKRGNPMLLVALFALSSAVLVGLFALAWHFFFSNSFGSSSCVATTTSVITCHVVRSTDPITTGYFSATVFFTLGFGDILPLDTTGKILVMLESWTGVTHMVAFFSLSAANIARRTTERSAQRWATSQPRRAIRNRRR